MTFVFVHQESEGQGCPFCRCEIKGTEPIVVDPFHPKANGASFAGFQASGRAEAVGNDEEEDDRLEDQQLMMSRLACSKVAFVRRYHHSSLGMLLLPSSLRCSGGTTPFACVPAAPSTPPTGPPAAEGIQLPQCTWPGSHSQGNTRWKEVFHPGKWPGGQILFLTPLSAPSGLRQPQRQASSSSSISERPAASSSS